MLETLTGPWRDALGLVPRPVRRGALAVVILAVVLAVVRSGSDAQPRSQVGATSAGHVGAPMLRRDGAAVLGVMRTTDGAAAAAISYVQQRNALLTGGTTAATAAEVGGTIAVGGHDVGEDPASIPDRVGTSNLTAQLQTRAGQLSWWTIPFGYRVRARSYTAGRAVVRVFAGLLSAGAQVSSGPAALSLNLQDVEVRWREGAWRIWRVDDARDQPTANAAFGVSTRRDVLHAELRDRVVPTLQQSGVSLFGFLRDATPILSGPSGLGPIVGTRPLDADAAKLTGDLVGLIARGIDRHGMARGGAPNRWLATVPIALKRTRCEQPAADGDERCYLALLVGVGTEGAPALVTFSLAGVRFDRDGQMAALDLSTEQERDVLGGQVAIATQHDDRRRTGGAAWNRSVVGLLPTVPAVPR